LAQSNITQIFWSAAQPESAEHSPRDVARHALRCLEAFDAGIVVSPRTGKPTKLMELLATMGMEEDLVYASPELARGESFDERSLVFTLGVLIFERLTGRHPFGTSDAGAKVARIRRGEMGSGVNYFPRVPADLRGILMRAMGPFPEERFHSLEEMKQALRRFGGVAGLAAEGRPKFFDAPTRVAGPEELPDIKTQVSAAPSFTGGDDPGQQAGWDTDRTPVRAIDIPDRQGTPGWLADRTEPPDAVQKELARLFEDSTDQSGEALARASAPRPGDLPTSNQPLPLAGSRSRRSPGRLLTILMPVIYVSIGAVLASLVFLLFSKPAPRVVQLHERVTPGAVQPKSSERPGDRLAPEPKPSAPEPKPLQPKPPEPKPPEPKSPSPEGPGDRPTPAPPGTPAGEAAGIEVGQAIRSCVADGVRVRVAVYLLPTGTVRRAFVSPGPGVKSDTVKCVRDALGGMSLPLGLKKQDFVEWQLTLDGATVKARVVRPAGLR